jgi:RHS repeat-associated protein
LSGKTPILRDSTFDANGHPTSAGRLYYTSDANTNVTALVSATGQVVERYYYSAYGNVTFCDASWAPLTSGGTNTRTPRSPSAVGNTTLYASMVLDPRTGLFYDEARWYDASVSTFVSMDPAGADQNLYRYSGNNPVACVDPSGDTKQVYAFEGRGGYPGANQLPAKTPGGAPIEIQGPMSPSQVLNYWYDAVQAAGKDVQWHYLAAEGNWRIDRDQIAKDAKTKHKNADGNDCYDTIVLLGYSAGGWKVKDLSFGLLNDPSPGGGVKADLAITVDPHPPELRGGAVAVGGTLAGLDTPAKGGKSIKSWSNYYQRLDQKSLAGFPLQGYQIDAAANHLVGEGYFGTTMRIEYAHIVIPTLSLVTNAITTSIKNLPPTRTFYR